MAFQPAEPRTSPPERRRTTATTGHRRRDAQYSAQLPPPPPCRHPLLPRRPPHPPRLRRLPRSRHTPPAHFSAAQLARAPKARRCRGSAGVLRVCPHLALTYAQMRDVRERGAPEARSAFEVEVECGECPLARMTRYPGGPTFGDGGQREVYRVVRRLEFDGLVVEGGGHDGGGDGGGSGGGGDGGRLVVSRQTDFTLGVVLHVLRTVAERHSVFICNRMRLDDP